MNRSLVRALVTAALATLVQLPAQAADWPTRTVRILVGSAPGGGTDAMARAVADGLTGVLKSPVIVENRPGVSNTLAADVAAKSTDGHTLLMGVVTAQSIVPHLIKLPYDTNRDLVAVAFVGSVPNVLVVNNDLPVTSVQSLIALAKQKPGRLNYASSGAGSTQHIAAEMFQDLAGVKLAHVPYRGSGPALVDLMGGQVQMSFDTMPSVISQVKGGRIKALAVASATRSPMLPNVPTFAEAGLKGMEMSAWYGIYMPASAPKAVQERVHDAVNQVLAMPETRARLATIGADVTTMTQAQFNDFQLADHKRFGDFIVKKQIKVE